MTFFDFESQIYYDHFFLNKLEIMHKYYICLAKLPKTALLGFHHLHNSTNLKRQNFLKNPYLTNAHLIRLRKSKEEYHNRY